MPATTQPKARKRRLQLTKEQTDPLWYLRTDAWRQHCADNGLDDGDNKAKEVWWREVLRSRLGFQSLTQVPRAGAPYITLMAALEETARNGIRWQMKIHGAEIRPLVHAIHDLIDEWHLDEHYVCGIAKQQLQVDVMPALHTLTPAQLLTLLQILHGKAAELKARAA